MQVLLYIVEQVYGSVNLVLYSTTSDTHIRLQVCAEHTVPTVGATACTPTTVASNSALLKCRRGNQ